MVFLHKMRYLPFAVTYFLFSIMFTKWLNTSSFLSWKSNANSLISFWYMLMYWGVSRLNADKIQNLAVSDVAFQIWYSPAGIFMQYCTSCKDYGVPNFWSHSSHSILIETVTRYVLVLKRNKHREKFWIILNKFCWKFSNI